MAETGLPPGRHLESEVGASGGGFDRLRFRFPDSLPSDLRREDISTRLLLNRRGDSRPKVAIDVPWYGGGMSFGSTNIRALAGQGARGKGVEHLHLHRRGRLSRPLHAVRRPRDHAGGHRALRRARGDHPAGADRGVQVRPGRQAGPGRSPAGRQEHPGRGGACARRSSGVALFSPFPFHSVYSVEDHKKHLDWIKHVNPRALISVKVSTPTDVDMVAVGSLLRRAPTSCTSTAATAAPAPRPKSPRRTSPCRSSTRSPRCTSSWWPRASATRSR